MTETPARKASEKRQRNAFLFARVTDEEKAQAQAAAKLTGMSLQAFIRHQTLGKPGPRSRVQRPIPPELLEIARLRADLGAIGNNLNQLTRAVNMGDLERPADLDEALTRVLDVLYAAQDATRTGKS